MWWEALLRSTTNNDRRFLSQLNATAADAGKRDLKTLCERLHSRGCMTQEELGEVADATRGWNPARNANKGPNYTYLDVKRKDVIARTLEAARKRVYVSA